MRKSLISEAQVIKILKRAGAGQPVVELCIKLLRISQQTYLVVSEIGRDGGFQCAGTQLAARRESAAEILGSGAVASATPA